VQREFPEKDESMLQCCGAALVSMADPVPAFCINADPDPDPRQTLESQKVEFLK
jgi:hypothetical protein